MLIVALLIAGSQQRTVWRGSSRYLPTSIWDDVPSTCKTFSDCRNDYYWCTSNNCVARRTTGRLCFENLECTSGMCHFNSGRRGTCLYGRLFKHETCQYDKDCSSGYLCKSKICTARPIANSGASCKEDLQCLSRKCRFSSRGVGTCM